MLKDEQNRSYNGGEVSRPLKKRSDFSSRQYLCYGEQKDPSSCNTTVYLSWLIHLEYVLEGKVHR